ncbi:hypothetical protein AMATHDRAFT_108160, partial [Amanita thiersii Skay4041]
SSSHPFDPSLPLNYLNLSLHYDPSPLHFPIAFLINHLPNLPPHIARHFSIVTTPKQRTVIPTIRNRRLKYTTTGPVQLSFQTATRRWPHLWPGRERGGVEENREEKNWVEQQFLQGNKQHVGKLGTLLGEYEEEREAERIRTLRREKASLDDEFVPEEEDESEEEFETETETEEEARAWFERHIREQFIYVSQWYQIFSHVQDIDYDLVDWDETLDTEDDREAEERWFDEE